MIVDFGDEGIRMDYVSVLAVWALAAAGPCVVSWLAGDRAGANRTRRLYAGAHAMDDANANLEAQETADAAFRVEDWRVPGRVHPLRPTDQNREDADQSAAYQPPSCEELAKQAEHRRLRRAAFATQLDQCDACEDWEEADRVLRSRLASRRDVSRRGDTPGDPITILRRYERSIESARGPQAVSPMREQSLAGAHDPELVTVLAMEPTGPKSTLN